MRTTVLATFLLCVLALRAQQKIQIPHSGTAVTNASGRAKITPSGSNDGPAISAAAAKGPIEMACSAAACTFKMLSTTLPANADIYIDDNVIVSDMSGYGNYDVMLGVTSANIKIAGSGSAAAGLLTMPNSYAKNIGNTNQKVNQHNHCVWFSGASNSSVSGLRFNRCGGDSVYVSSSSNITVKGNVSVNPIRNGCSITDNPNGVLVDSNEFSGANNSNAGIADGCDLEPNGAKGSVKGVVLKNNYFHDNGRSGLCICLYFTNSSTPIDVTVTNNRAERNKMTGYEANSWPSPMNGSVKGSGNMQNGVAMTFPPATR